MEFCPECHIRKSLVIMLIFFSILADSVALAVSTSYDIWLKRLHD